jgi:thiol:disulfide interchange protein DsbD
MIPITAGMLGGAGAIGRSRRRTVVLSLVYALGLAAVYATLGLVAGLSGSIFGTISSNPWAYLVMGNLLLLAALAMLDVIPVRLPSRLLTWASKAGARTRGEGSGAGPSVGAVFAMGATSGLVAAPCGAPAFAAVLTFVSATQSAVLGFLYLFVFSLGMTALLVAVGIFAGTVGALPRPGRWTVWVKRVGGALLLAMAEYYLIKAGQVY